jgi:hypothetical protein
MRQAKQVTGFESAQVRNEEAVKRHFRLSCVAQSILQSLPCQGQKSERFMFAHNQQTVGQKLYSLTWLRLPPNAASGARSICPQPYLRACFRGANACLVSSIIFFSVRNLPSGVKHSS